MVILCPSCGSSFDIRGYPIGYTFSCYCGQTIQCPQVMDGSSAQGHPSQPPQPASHAGVSHHSHEQVPSVSYEEDMVGEATRRVSVEDLRLEELGLESDLHQETVSMMSPLLEEDAELPEIPREYKSSSQDRLEQYSDDLKEPRKTSKKEEEFKRKVDGRAVWAIILFPFLVFGPFVLLMSFSAMRRIRRYSDVLKGIWLARLGFLIGLTETAILGAAVTLWFSPGSFPEPLQVLRAQVARSLGQNSPGQNITLEKQPATLGYGRALSLLQQSYPFGKAPSVAPSSFVYQPPNAHYAYLVWKSTSSDRVHQSLFHYSNSQHWHLVTRNKGRVFETRVAQEGGDELNEATASSLIKNFWKVRGRFAGVSIHHISVLQKPNSHQAVAYWQLHKQRDGKTTKTNIKTLFYRAHTKKWHLVVYARPLPARTVLSIRKQGSERLKLETAKTLFEQYWKSKGIEQEGEVRLVHQAIDSPQAFGCWEPKTPKRSKTPPKASCARFQRVMGGDWLLFSPEVGSQHLLQPLKTRAAELVLGDALEALKVDITRGAAYVYQPPKQMSAQVFWQVKLGRSNPTHKATFLRTVDGTWYLMSSGKIPFQDLRIGDKGELPLPKRVAQELLQKFWRENEKYAGLRMKSLYVYQNSSNKRETWAHWIAINGSQRIRIRSLFQRSNQGNWFLKRYRVNPGYSQKFKSAGQAKLSREVARKILEMTIPKSTNGLGVAPKLQSLYVFQAPNASVAYIRWILLEDGKSKAFFSQLHRSFKNTWYLSNKQLLWIPPR